MIFKSVKLLVLIFIILLNNCTYFFIPKSIKKGFNGCDYLKEFEFPTSLIKEGFYSASINDTIKKNNSVTSNSHRGNSLVLLKNGKAAYSWFSINYLNKVFNTRNLSEKEYGNFFYWGNYKTSNDSLFVTYIMPPSSMLDTNWSLYEIIFLVKNKRKLKMLHYKVLPGYVHDVSKFSDFNFYESEKLPDMNIPSRFKYLYACD